MTADTTAFPSGADDEPTFDIDPNEDAAAYDEWAVSPANRLGRRLIIRNAISPIINLLSARSPRA
jgi:hypothetical protein